MATRNVTKTEFLSNYKLQILREEEYLSHRITCVRPFGYKLLATFSLASYSWPHAEHNTDLTYVAAGSKHVSK